MKTLSILPILASLLVFSCSKGDDPRELASLEIMEVPSFFPAIEHTEGNDFTIERWKLGKELFYDPILSLDGSISCASCHDPALAFSDNKPFSLGVYDLPGTRNAPSLTNIAYHPYLTREGGLPTLEMHILVPIQEHNEFNHNIVLIADTLSKIGSYIEMAKIAYDREPDAFVITRALALFERSMISGQSTYDSEFNYNEAGSMSASALRGKVLFESEKAACSTCHGGFNFTDYSFQNNGLYEVYLDEGRARLTQKLEDQALFKVPSLRNIEVTKPYMHDGSIGTLTEVIEHYNNGGSDYWNKSASVRPLNLTAVEKVDLLSFLESLTDINFLTNKNLAND